MSVTVKTSSGFNHRLITVGQVKEAVAKKLNVLIHGFDLVQGNNVLQDSASADAYFGIMKPVQVVYRPGYGTATVMPDLNQFVTEINPTSNMTNINVSMV